MRIYFKTVFDNREVSVEYRYLPKAKKISRLCDLVSPHSFLGGELLGTEVTWHSLLTLFAANL
jgi:hypothetical protein